MGITVDQWKDHKRKQIPPVAEQLNALMTAAAVTIRAMVSDDKFGAEDILSLAPLYPEWTVGAALRVCDVVRYGDKLYKVVQAHTSQADWAPDKAPALFAVVRVETPGKLLPWVAGEAVEVGDQRVYKDKPYGVLQAHTTQTGWEPPGLPALWKAVT